VIAVGPGAPNKEGQIMPTSVKAGDRVLLPGWGGNALKVGEEVRVFFLLVSSVKVADVWLLGYNNTGLLFVQGFGDIG
jgi:co-chaperonin GroES (HSP10)